MLLYFVAGFPKRVCFRHTRQSAPRTARWLCSTAPPRGVWDLENRGRPEQKFRPSSQGRPQRRELERNPQSSSPYRRSGEQSPQQPASHEDQKFPPSQRNTGVSISKSRIGRRPRETSRLGRLAPDYDRNASHNSRPQRVGNEWDRGRNPERDSERYRSEQGLSSYAEALRGKNFSQKYSPPPSDMYDSFTEKSNTVDRWTSSRRRIERGIASHDREGQSELQLLRDSDAHDLLYGISPILAALRAGRRKWFTLFVQEDRFVTEKSDLPQVANKFRTETGPSRKPGQDAAIREIMLLARGQQFEIRYLSKGELNVLVRDRPHQGFVLRASPLEYEDMAALDPPSVAWSKEPAPLDAQLNLDPADHVPVWLVLDEVTDPQNFGALIRSAYFLGASGVIACRRNSSALTATVSKASSGALEAIPVYGVASMPRFLRRAAEDGWRIVGTALSPKAVAAREVDRGAPTLLVLGSEGRGLRPMVQDACHVLMRIDGRAANVADVSVVDSLNVSVAGAIALHHLLG